MERSSGQGEGLAWKDGAGHEMQSGPEHMEVRGRGFHQESPISSAAAVLPDGEEGFDVGAIDAAILVDIGAGQAALPVVKEGGHV